MEHLLAVENFFFSGCLVPRVGVVKGWSGLELLLEGSQLNCASGLAQEYCVCEDWKLGVDEYCAEPLVARLSYCSYLLRGWGVEGVQPALRSADERQCAVFDFRCASRFSLRER